MFRSILALVFAGSPVLAACPQGPVEDAGIVLTRDNPFFSIVLRPDGAGLEERRVMVEGDAVLPVSTVYLHPLLTKERLSKNGTISLSYTSPIEPLDRLPEIGEWTSEVTLSVDGQLASTGTSTLRFLDLAFEDIGECVYPVWEIEDRLTFPDRAEILSRRYYAPELRIVLRVVSFEDGTPMTEVRFDRIETGQTN